MAGQAPTEGVEQRRRGRPPVERVRLPCAGCGADVTRRQSDMARLKTSRVFCSKVCRDLVGCKPRRGTAVPCQCCGADVYQPLGTVRSYCGKKCHDQAQRVQQVTLQCRTCGAPFSVRPSQQQRKYCSRDCVADGQIIRKLDRTHNGRPVRMKSGGYLAVWEPDHPDAYEGWVWEHRLVAEKALGQRLDSAEQVHHINRNKTDNRPENLAVLSGRDHGAVTALDNWRDLRLLKETVGRYRELFGDLPEA